MEVTLLRAIKNPRSNKGKKPNFLDVEVIIQIWEDISQEYLELILDMTSETCHFVSKWDHGNINHSNVTPKYL